jgi:hypothetical protein
MNCTAHSQAHLQLALSTLQTKKCKKTCLSVTADFTDMKKLNLLKRFYCKFRGRIVCKTSYLIGIKDFEVFFMSLCNQ